MKREILFRGKRLDNHDWTYGDLMQDRDLGTACISGLDYYVGETGIEREPFLYEVDTDTIGQFIGMTDKNGMKIFDGDIVKGNDYRMIERNCIVEYGHLCIGDFYDTYGFSFRSKEDGLCSFHDPENIEVIGNVIDNSEFLEVES